ncbi:MAG: hypothetical protein IIA70_08530 [Proteobacteria bacterium]|nr:hypothetical protein [Pseudomonadota bacterium]
MFLSSFEARADNWVEIETGSIWYNSDYTFFDRGTGYIVLELAEADSNGDFSYFLDAIDCDSWVIYVLAVKDDYGNFDIVPNWNTDPTLSGSIVPGSIVEQVAMRVCPDCYSLPTANMIP